MDANFRIGDETWRFDPTRPIDISIPLDFNGPQPNAYGVDAATSEPCRAGDLIGDTRHGGSCNFEQYTLIPHCNGTHTECVGHITNERISVRDCLQDVLLPALLVSVEAVPANRTSDSYSIQIAENDLLITRESIAAAINHLGISSSGLSNYCLIIRTLPNDDTKLTRQYLDALPAYFTAEAMEYIVERGFKHLVVDLPSIDRTYDEGRLPNHRKFWKVAEGSFETGVETRRSSTVTELAYVPPSVADGVYVINFQIAPFASDASPSRPVLFRVGDL